MLVFALVGLIVVLRGSPNTSAIAGGGLGLLGLAVGLSEIPVLLHGVVLSALPAGLARTPVVLTIWAGAAATAAGLSVFNAVPDSAPGRDRLASPSAFDSRGQVLHFAFGSVTPAA